MKALIVILLMPLFALAAETGARKTPAAKPAAASAAKSAAMAAAKRPGAKRDSGVAAVIRSDSAMIYSKPDFDADVLTTLKQGDRVRVSSGTLGDYAKFHKVAAGAVVGWIADMDVQVEGATKKRDHKRGAGKKPREKKPFMDESLPIFFNRYVGVIIGVSDFNESISGVDSHESLLVYGVKITGPDTIFATPTDINLLLHYGAPSYYDSLSKSPPKGFVFMADALLLYPFFNRDKGMVSFGIGPLLKFSSFSVLNGGEPRALSEFDIGASFQLSGAMKFGKTAVRLEGKYLLEKHQEKLFQLAIQQQF